MLVGLESLVQGLVGEAQRLLLAVAMLGLVLAPMPASAASATPVLAGTAVVSSGTVEATDAAGIVRPVAAGGEIYEGDTLVTGPDGRLLVRFVDGARLSMREDSEIVVSAYRNTVGAERSDLELRRGGFRKQTGRIAQASRTAYRVRTPLATIGVRGTVFDAFQIPGGESFVGIEEGVVRTESFTGNVADLAADAGDRFLRVNLDGTITSFPTPPPQLQNNPSVAEPGASSSSAGGGGSSASGAGGAGGAGAGAGAGAAGAAGGLAGGLAGIGLATAIAAGLAVVAVGAVVANAVDDDDNNDSPSEVVADQPAPTPSTTPTTNTAPSTTGAAPPST